ncbi:glucokinase [Lachnospiraceae bacterium C7]|nr:glucokinase [Lachnospiraceae bacterium C7]
MEKKRFGFGIDIGGTTIKMGFFEYNGTLVEKWEIPTDKTNDGANILTDIANAIEGKIKEHNVAKSDVVGVGMGIPGPVKADGTVNRCVNLGWGVFNAAEALENIIGLPVKVGNDANVAALGEMWQGGGKGYEDVVVVTLGTGVGGGIIIGGQMVAGANGAGGEIGHITMNREELETCGCGKCGCLEQYASATGVVRLATRRLKKNDDASKLRDLDNITSKDVFDLAKANDKVANEVVDKVSEYLGLALANITCVVNPQVIVIGGGVSKAGSILTDTVKKHFVDNAFHACKDTEFKLAELGNDAGIYGGMKLVMD